MHAIAPLTVAIPLLMAAILTATGAVGLRNFATRSTILTAIAVTVFCAVLLLGSLDARIIDWFGGWLPRGGAAIGIAFVIDPLGGNRAARRTADVRRRCSIPGGISRRSARFIPR